MDTAPEALFLERFPNDVLSTDSLFISADPWMCNVGEICCFQRIAAFSDNTWCRLVSVPGLEYRSSLDLWFTANEICPDEKSWCIVAFARMNSLFLRAEGDGCETGPADPLSVSDI